MHGLLATILAACLSTALDAVSIADTLTASFDEAVRASSEGRVVVAVPDTISNAGDVEKAVMESVAKQLETVTHELAPFVQSVSEARASPHWSSSGSSTSTYGVDTWLRKWLNSLQVHIPTVTVKATVPIVKLNLTVIISNTLCNGIAIDSIDSDNSTADWGFQFLVKGFAIRCALDWTVVPTGGDLGLSGHVIAEVGGGSSFGGFFEIIDDSGTPPLPKELKGSCTGLMNVTSLKFSKDILAPFLNKFLSGAIKALVTSQVAPAICKEVNTIEGDISKLLPIAMTIFRGILAAPSKSPLPPEHLPSGNWVDFSSNSGLKMIHNILSRTLMNTSSPYYLNGLMTLLLGPEGHININNQSFLPILPLSIPIHLGNLGDLKITLNTLSVAGLNKWSALDVNTPTPQKVGLAIGLDTLAANASVTLEVQLKGGGPIPMQGDILSESFDMNLLLHPFSATATGYLAADGKQLSKLYADQLVHVGCLATGILPPILATQSDLKLDISPLQFQPTTGHTLDQDVDKMINLVLGNTMGQFSSTITDVSHWLASVALRDSLNQHINTSLAANPTCPAPLPNYADKQFADRCRLAGVIVVIVSILYLGLRCATARCSRKSARQADKKPDDTPADPTSIAVAPPTEGAEGRGGLALPLTSDPESGPPAAGAPANKWDCLALNPRIPRYIAFGLPMMALGNIIMFASGTYCVGANVMVSIQANGEDVVNLPPVFQFGLWSGVKDMYDAGAWYLSIVIFVFSGAWPFVKVLILLFCWFLPTNLLPVNRRLTLLNFVDQYGKYSLVDSFVMILCMVAFDFDFSTYGHLPPWLAEFLKDADAGGQVRVYMDPTFGFQSFLFATIISLFLGHLFCGFHRYAHKVGEYGVAEVYGTGPGTRRRLCDVLRPEYGSGGKTFVYLPVVCLILSLVLVCFGIGLDTFEFDFLGLTGWILGDARKRAKSVISLGNTIPEASPWPDSLRIRWIQTFFFFFAIVLVIVYHMLLFLLWLLPLTNKMQRHLLVACQIGNAWQGLDVFCVAIMSGVLQLQQLIGFVVGHKCDGIDAIVAKTPIAKEVPGPMKCFDVDCILSPGFFVLALSALISLITGEFMMRRCSSALCSVQ